MVRGTGAAIAAVLAATGTGTGINTAYIERLNATFRATLSPLVRRGRALVGGAEALAGGMYLVGCAYNFCWEHDSLRMTAAPGERLKWRARTPAMAAGLTDHRWTMRELLSNPIRLPPWVAPKRRGRPPKGRCEMGHRAPRKLLNQVRGWPGDCARGRVYPPLNGIAAKKRGAQRSPGRKGLLGVRCGRVTW